jgi:hypothetical protein
LDRPAGKNADDRTDSPRTPEGRQHDTADSPIAARSPGLPDRAAYWAEYKKSVEAEYRDYAVDQGCDRVRETEETVVTPAMRRIEAEDPDRHLTGLEYRLKGKDRITEKVLNHIQSNPDISYNEAFAKVKDAIRYTFQYAEQHYAEGVRADAERLKARFDPVDLRNTWSAEEYKGINSRWRVPENGQVFEVQFHTEASFRAKQETHVAYEKLRSPDTPKAERDALEDYQREVSTHIPMPRGATDIPNYP